MSESKLTTKITLKPNNKNSFLIKKSKHILNYYLFLYCLFPISAFILQLLLIISETHKGN